jgi:hypothetical protein
MSRRRKEKNTPAAAAKINTIAQEDCKQTSSMGNAWVMNTRRQGDLIAGWQIERLFDDIRLLENSERCELTSFCYPGGAKMVRAQLQQIATA